MDLVEKIDQEQLKMGNLDGPHAKMPELGQASLAASSVSGSIDTSVAPEIISSQNLR